MRVASKPCIPRMFCTYHRGSSTNHPFAVALGLLKCQFVFLFVEIALILPRLSGADLAYVSRSTLENFYHCLTQNRSKQLASDDVANSDNFKVIEKLTKTTKYPLISLAQPQFVFLEQKGPPRSRFRHGVKWAREISPLWVAEPRLWTHLCILDLTALRADRIQHPLLKSIQTCMQIEYMAVIY